MQPQLVRSADKFLLHFLWDSCTVSTIFAEVLKAADLTKEYSDLKIFLDRTTILALCELLLFQMYVSIFKRPNKSKTVHHICVGPLREGLFSPKTSSYSHRHAFSLDHILCSTTRSHLRIWALSLSYSFTDYFSQKKWVPSAVFPHFGSPFKGSALQCLKLCMSFKCTTFFLFCFIAQIQRSYYNFCKDVPTLEKQLSQFANKEESLPNVNFTLAFLYTNGFLF